MTDVHGKTTTTGKMEFRPEGLAITATGVADILPDGLANMYQGLIGSVGTSDPWR